MMDPEYRSEAKKMMENGSAGSSGVCLGRKKSFHESLRGLRAEYARTCVSKLREAVGTGIGCLPGRRPVSLELLLATLRSFHLGWNGNSSTLTEIDAQRRAQFIVDVNSETTPGLIELLLKETSAYIRSDAAQLESLKLRLSLLSTLHRCCEPLCLTYQQLCEIWPAEDRSVEIRAVFLSWLRAALTYTSTHVPKWEGGFECCHADTPMHVLARLGVLHTSEFDLQSYHLFQSVMVAVNASLDRLQLGGWDKDSTPIDGNIYCCASAQPAKFQLEDETGDEILELRAETRTTSISCVTASSKVEVHGHHSIPDGSKLVGTWVKVLQDGAVQWKDGECTAYYPHSGGRAMYDISYVDGSTHRRNLHEIWWTAIQPPAKQAPMSVNVKHVADADLRGLDGLWRAAVHAEDEAVSQLARSFIFKIYTKMRHTVCSGEDIEHGEIIEQALATADAGMLEMLTSEGSAVSLALARKALVLTQNNWQSAFEWIQSCKEQAIDETEANTPLTLLQARNIVAISSQAPVGPDDLRGQLVSTVAKGLGKAIAMFDTDGTAGGPQGETAIRRQLVIVQSFVDNYRTNAKHPNHLSSRRGQPVSVKLQHGSLDVHSNITTAMLHQQVCEYLSKDAATGLDVHTTNSAGKSISFALPRTQETLAGLGVAAGTCEVRTRSVMGGIVDAPEVEDTFSPADLLAVDEQWCRLLLQIIELPLSASTGEAVWHLLMTIPTITSELKDVQSFRINWSGGSFLRTVYDLQVVESIIDPPFGDDLSSAQVWRRSFISTGNHFRSFVEFVTDIEARGGDLADPTVCAKTLPVCLRILYFCVAAALSDDPADLDTSPDDSGLERSLSTKTAETLFDTLQSVLGAGYFGSLICTICSLMEKADAAVEKSAAIAGHDPAVAQATIFGAKTLVTIAQHRRHNDALADILAVGVPVMIKMVFSSLNQHVRECCAASLQSIAMISQDTGLEVMQAVRACPISVQFSTTCGEYFGLLKELQRYLPSAREEFFASLVDELRQTQSLSAPNDSVEKLIAARLELLADVLMQGSSIRSLVNAELIDLLWERYLMAVSDVETDTEKPICQSQTSRGPACNLLKSCVSQHDHLTMETLSHYMALVALATNFLMAMTTPLRRGGDPDFDYDPAKRSGYDDSTPFKLRNVSRMAGLSNQGNTCYMNSVLQQLYGASEVRRAVLDIPFMLRVRVDNRDASLAANVTVSLHGAPGGEILLSPDGGLASGNTGEFCEPLPPGPYEIRAVCQNKVSKCVHEFGVGAHTVRLSNNEESGELDQKLQAEPVVSEIHRCFSFLQDGAAASVDTSSLCDALHEWRSRSGGSFLEYPIRSQNDASEFLGKLVDTIGTELKGLPTAGQLERVVTCKTIVEKHCHCCNQVSRGPEEDSVLVPVAIETPLGHRWDSLEQALEHRSKAEIMSGANAVWCDTCAAKAEETSYTSAISTLPSVLLVQLGRFMQDMYGNYRKCNHRVSFPQRLDMWPYTTAGIQARRDATVERSEHWYSLSGVILHSGTHRAGHYTSLAKHQDSWYNFDDQFASKFDGDLEDMCYGGQEEVVGYGGKRHLREKSKNAYILVYRLEGAEVAAEGGAMPALPASEGETPDLATWGVRRELREQIRETQIVLERQERVFDPDVLALLRQLCSLGLSPPNTGGEGVPAGVVTLEPGMQGSVFELAIMTFVRVVCRYRHHPELDEWADLLVSVLSQSEQRQSAAEWLIQRLGGEDGWQSGEQLLSASICRAPEVRTAFARVAQAAVDTLRGQSSEAPAVEPEPEPEAETEPELEPEPEPDLEPAALGTQTEAEPPPELHDAAADAEVASVTSSTHGEAADVVVMATPVVPDTGLGPSAEDLAAMEPKSAPPICPVCSPEPEPDVDDDAELPPMDEDLRRALVSVRRRLRVNGNVSSSSSNNASTSTSSTGTGRCASSVAHCLLRTLAGA
jgi:hypothetical protein